ncbi:MAG: hypothetical protein ACHBNF_22195 [Chromatiales bacterium]
MALRVRRRRGRDAALLMLRPGATEHVRAALLRLSEWVPNTLSLEAAVARLTLMPATVHGLHDRGG